MRLLRQPYEEGHVARNLGLLPTISEELRGLLPVTMLVDLLPLVKPLSEEKTPKIILLNAANVAGNCWVFCCHSVYNLVAAWTRTATKRREPFEQLET